MMADSRGEAQARSIVIDAADAVEREAGVTIDSDAREEVVRRLLRTDVVASLADDEHLRNRVVDATKDVFRQAAAFSWAEQQELAYAGPGDDSSPPVVGALAFFKIRWPYPFGPV